VISISFVNIVHAAPGPFTDPHRNGSGIGKSSLLLLSVASTTICTAVTRFSTIFVIIIDAVHRFDILDDIQYGIDDVDGTHRRC
jgi:hypothetical protein